MGSGAAPAASWTISNENLEKIVPVEYKQLIAVLDKHQETLDGFAIQLSMDENLLVAEDAQAELESAFDALLKAFKTVTTVDGKFLELELQYYDADSGDIYDDLENGAIWLVDGVQQLSPPGKKFNDFVEFSQWTQYG